MHEIAASYGVSPLVRDVERGLRHDEFFYLLQPRYELQHARLVGFEYLIRWQHADGSVRGPASFLSFIEDSQLAGQFTERLLARAVAMLGHWQERGYETLSLAINVSPGEFGRDDFPDSLSTLLSLHGICPWRLEIDLTGVVTPERLDWLVRAIQAVQAIGVRVALDDFGTAFNALTLLQQVPVDIIKFDRAMIRAVPTDAEFTATVETLIRIAQGLGKQIVLKGLETAAQVDWARTLPAVEGQGYYICEPVGEAAIDEIVARRMHS